MGQLIFIYFIALLITAGFYKKAEQSLNIWDWLAIAVIAVFVTIALLFLVVLAICSS